MLLSSRQPQQQRRLTLAIWILIAALPVAYITGKVWVASRNIVFWDEFDTALGLILRINAGADWHELLQRFFAVSNEHRTVTSRLIFALSYWLTGTVNFHVIGAIGNLFLVGGCAALVLAIGSWERKIRLGVVLVFLIFQLEHFENFLWSGASIDHFQVVALGVVSLIALARGTWTACMGAIVFGLLATFTLAQGCTVWPVGALLLWQQRRWRPLAVWAACATGAMVGFLHGFELNPAHNILEINGGSVAHIAGYWLALLGGPLTLGDADFARIPGIFLLAGLTLLAARGALRREPIAMSCALFAVAALGLVALGRSELAGPEINSRYLVLGALAWALFIFMLVEAASPATRPFQWLCWLVPALAVFNVCANLRYSPLADGFIEVRDRAASRFLQFEQDGKGITRLHPRDGHADALLKLANQRGVYRLPEMSSEADFDSPQVTQRIITYIDEMFVNDHAVTVGGWAMMRGHESKRGEVYLVLRSDKSTLFFSSVPLQRPDVAKAYNEPKWRWSGFRAVISRPRLPSENFEIGVLIDDGAMPEYIMTSNRLELAQVDARAVRVASGQ